MRNLTIGGLLIAFAFVSLIVAMSNASPIWFMGWCCVQPVGFVLLGSGLELARQAK